MIDLRSDTGTLPTDEMRVAMAEAKVGDDGRVGVDGKGEDPTVVQLERLATTLTGKEDALFCNSGTMANIVTIITKVKRGEFIVLDKNSHIYLSERAIFSEEVFGREALFIETDEFRVPNLAHLKDLLTHYDVKLLCLENPMAFYGGTCLPASKINEICSLAAQFNVPVHIDGARIFNVATSLNTTVSSLVQPAQTVMFCLSKGLSAPVGSVICGDKDFIAQARVTRKAIGGNMRQSGVIAAAGIIALSEVEDLQEDHDKATLFARLIKIKTRLTINLATVQTNIVNIDVKDAGMTSVEIEKVLASKGLLVKSVTPTIFRAVFHKEIKNVHVYKAAEIINVYFKSD